MDTDGCLCQDKNRDVGDAGGAGGDDEGTGEATAVGSSENPWAYEEEECDGEEGEADEEQNDEEGEEDRSGEGEENEDGDREAEEDAPPLEPLCQ